MIEFYYAIKKTSIKKIARKKEKFAKKNVWDSKIF